MRGPGRFEMAMTMLAHCWAAKLLVNFIIYSCAIFLSVAAANALFGLGL